MDIIKTSGVTDSDTIQVSSVGLIVTNDLTYEDWCAFGLGLSQRYSGIQWQIGDWLNAGERLFGESYAQAADDICFAPGTLRNYASICARIPFTVRDARLHFHRTKYVAPLLKSEQHLLIQFAIEHHLTGEDIKSLVDKQLNRQPPPVRHYILKEIEAQVDWTGTLTLDIGRPEGAKVKVDVWTEE